MREITPTFNWLLFIAAIGLLYCLDAVAHRGGLIDVRGAGALFGMIAIGAWIGRSYSKAEDELRADREAKKSDRST